MQLLGWPFHSGWMLLTVVSVCCCIDIGSPSEVSEEAVEEQPMSWNELKYGALRKYHSIVDVGGGGIEGDAVSETAPEQTSFESQRARYQNNPYAMSDTEEDYIYDVEGRPSLPAERYEFYYKPVDAKRSSSSSLKHQEANGFVAPVRRIRAQKDLNRLAAPSSTELEPRALPLLGSQAAVSKLNRQKEAFLKKILRQADAASTGNQGKISEPVATAPLH